MSRISYTSYPGQPANYNAAMKAVESLIELDSAPFRFRFQVDFQYKNGLAYGFKLKVYDINAAIFVTELRHGDLDQMKALIRAYKPKPAEESVLISFF